MVAEEHGLEGNHRLLHHLAQAGPPADLAEVLPIGLSFGQADDLALVHLDQEITEKQHDRLGEAPLAVQLGGLTEQIALAQGHAKRQGLDPIHVAQPPQIISHVYSAASFYGAQTTDEEE